MTTYSKETYDWCKSHKICADCKKEPAAPGKTRCLSCLSIRAEKERERLDCKPEEERAERKKKQRERQKAQREYRREHGLCYICGKPAYKNHSTCYEHYLQHKRVERKRQETRKKGYAELGLCRICGKPVVKGKKFCEAHLEQYRGNMRHAQAIRMEKQYERNKHGTLQG